MAIDTPRNDKSAKGDTLTPEPPPETAQIVTELRAHRDFWLRDAASYGETEGNFGTLIQTLGDAADRLAAQAARLAALEAFVREVADHYPPLAVRARRALVGEEAPS